MIRIFYLIWTLISSLLTTGLSFFYIRNEVSRGFPFSFAKEVLGQGGGQGISFEFKTFVVAFDIIFWWLIFSVLLVIIKNYIFEAE